MKTISAEEKILYYLHWLRIGQPDDMVPLTGLTLDHLQRVMPAMHDKADLHKIPWVRQKINDPRAGYENGPNAPLILRDTFGIPLRRTRYRQTPKLDNTRWIFERLFTTKVVVPMWASLGTLFTPRYVTNFKADVVHKDKRKKIGIKPDFDFDITIGGRNLLHHVEADNAGKDEDGTVYKSEPMTREDIEQESIFRKTLGYIAALRSGKRFRYLLVCRSHARATNVHEIIYPLLAKQGGEEFKKYIFVNYLQCLKSDPKGSWTNFAGESASLLPEGM